MLGGTKALGYTSSLCLFVFVCFGFLVDSYVFLINFF